MGEINYRKQYINTYIWQILSVVLGFLSLFIVTPYISSNKVLYGIYTLCISLNVFFSYADLGVISAASKYAAEYYIQGDIKKELEVNGFTAYIMLVTFSVLSLILFALSFVPTLVVPELEIGSYEYRFARGMLLVLAFSSPLMIFQRILQNVFMVRVKDYLFQRILTIANVVRILSVFYFFRDGKFLLLEYYVFYQFILLIVIIYGLLYIRRFGYRLLDFLKSIKYDRIIFDKVKKLSGVSLIMMLSTIFMYEFDQIAISHLIGIEAVAVYGIAITVFSFFRSWNSIVFSPYTSRYNHFHGLNDFEGLTAFVNKVILFIGPIFVIPIIVVSVTSRPFVESWVGPNYSESALLITFLILCFALNVFRTPISQYFIAIEKNQTLLYFALIEPIIYWCGIFILLPVCGVVAFAVFKFVAPLVTTFGFLFKARTDFIMRGYDFVRLNEVCCNVFLPILGAGFLSIVAIQFMSYIHSKYILMINLFVMSLCIFTSYVSSILFNKYIRMEAFKMININH